MSDEAADWADSLPEPGSTKRCPMCGWTVDAPRLRYCDAPFEVPGYDNDWIGYGRVGEPRRPHLHVYCGRCDYGWREKTMGGTA